VRNRPTKEPAKDRALKRQRAEDLLGPRGKLKLPSEYRNDDPQIVALGEWIAANGFPSWIGVQPEKTERRHPELFSVDEMTAAYNDRHGKKLDALRRKLDESGP
jgi:hypothetical protein